MRSLLNASLLLFLIPALSVVATAQDGIELIRLTDDAESIQAESVAYSLGDGASQKSGASQKNDASQKSCGCSKSGKSDCGCDAQPTCGCGGKSCGGCGAAARKKAAGAYKGMYFLNDYSYLCDPCYDDHLLGDRLKRMSVGNGILDLGGQLRLRYHSERGMKGQRFLANTDDFLLTRLRLFANYEVNDITRVYFEGLYADSAGHTLPPRGIDQNSMDIQNLLIDVKLTDTVTVRAGRQELLYGSQRVASPLDWANTRRKFEGMNVLYRDGDLSLDGFFHHYVPVLPNSIDEADYDQPFYGVYGIYSACSTTYDFYYLGKENSDIGQSLHTIGGRVQTKVNDILFDFEGATQFGRRFTAVNQEEGFATIGLGHAWTDCTWSPTVWFYFDYASENYNQLYPLAHKYLGFIDAVQRQNIESPNVLVKAKPHDKVTLLLWYYHLQSNSAAPVPSIGGAHPQNGSRYLGNELDILAKWQMTPRSDLVVGWSHFWKGSKIDNPGDADFAYSQLQIHF